MPADQKRVAVAFFRTSSGREPAREWLKELDADDRRIVGNDLQTLEYGWPIGMPLCRAINLERAVGRSSGCVPRA